MYLIVGLGNPGKEYELNRHNVGFIVLDSIISKYNLIQDKDKYNSLVYKGKIDNENIIAIKPMTFMNESGKAVSAFSNFYKIPADKIIVIYDDIALENGKVRLTVGGSDAGHNGIKSINSLITNKYIKIRVGVGHPGDRDFVTKHVLSNFTKDEQDTLNQVSIKITDLFEDLIKGDQESFASQVNQRK
jgi:peptidyl-tRNA hydrolase, PTH1 family